MIPSWYRTLFEIVDHYFRNLHHHLPFYLEALSEIHDPWQRVSALISNTRFGDEHSKVISRNLNFLEKHRSCLELGRNVIHQNDFSLVLIKIYELRLAFHHKRFQKLGNFRLKFQNPERSDGVGGYFQYEVIQLTFDFMINYDQVFTSRKIFLDVGHQVRSLLCPRYSPPKYKSMSWYRNNELNHTWFFWNRKIRFLKGQRAYEECLIRSINEEGVKVQYEDGTRAKISLDVPLSWGDPE